MMLLAACAMGISPQDKKKATAARNLGEVYISEGNYTAALGELLKAEKLTPNDPILHNDLGLAYMGKEKLDIAITHLEKAVQLNPNYAVAKNNLGAAYIMREDWDSAISTLQDVIDDIFYATPHFPLSNLGRAYYEKKIYSKAERYLLEALKLSPDFTMAQYYLGKTYLATGKLNDARVILEKATETDPKNPAFLLEIGKIYRLLGDKQSASLALKGAMELSQDSDIAVEAATELKKVYP